MLAVGLSEENVCRVGIYINRIFATIAASFFRELNCMQASGHELCIPSNIVRIVLPAVSIPIQVHIIQDGAYLHFEAQMVEYGVEDCVDALEGVGETLGIITLVVGIGVMAVEA